MAEELHYVPMPANVVKDIQNMWATEIKDASGKPIFVGDELTTPQTGKAPIGVFSTSSVKSSGRNGLHCGRTAA